ncbi:MAG: polyphenol oxidase family protein [Buchananella hordeovulneris]|nr:polyphenol oxidase family protein [Buchananella hordeovulneris]
MEERITAAGWVVIDLPGGSVVLTNARGGHSQGIWAGPGGQPGANMGDHVGDNVGHVLANRSELQALLPAHARLAWMNQVHSAACALAEEPGGQAAASAQVPTADALASTSPALSPVVVVADCVPIGLLAADGSVAAAVHAGRKGLLTGVVANAVRQARCLQSEVGSTAPLQAVIGAHICARCYEVSPELAAETKQTHPHVVAASRWGTDALDLRVGVLAELAAYGVEVAYASPDCTLENTDFYSYRRNGPTGRQALAVIAQHAAQNRGNSDSNS